MSILQLQVIMIALSLHYPTAHIEINDLQHEKIQRTDGQQLIFKKKIAKTVALLVLLLFLMFSMQLIDRDLFRIKSQEQYNFY